MHVYAVEEWADRDCAPPGGALVGVPAPSAVPDTQGGRGTHSEAGSRSARGRAPALPSRRSHHTSPGRVIAGTRPAVSEYYDS
ncbi:hypothetical protein CP972_05125 [Streptomyces prasinus]|uniref:Uncharacterized protein n=1 Tax=Streptomyces prasinus TaxID=67345 RepID=A0ABX6ATJ4_9ACTN|nr:hypothetical protein CP972_05125 [Streptomyces prasinus]